MLDFSKKQQDGLGSWEWQRQSGRRERKKDQVMSISRAVVWTQNFK